MLKQRVITALVLLAVLLPAIFAAESWPFALLAGVFMAAGAWEWGRLNGGSTTASLLLAAACAVLCAAAWLVGWATRPPPVVWWIGGLAWLVLAPGLLRAGVAGWAAIPVPARWAGGLVALWLAWLAVVAARQQGIVFLLSVLGLVWAADIAAYFAGRAWGLKIFARRLAPDISPGKTWEGAVGGAVGVALLALVSILVEREGSTAAPSLYTRLWSDGPALFVLALLLLTAMSVVGDLLESLVKRSAGVKDSSGLLPGHGGVLDRIDALLPTLPLAMMFIQGGRQ